jgi:uncharacterized membrane protein
LLVCKTSSTLTSWELGFGFPIFWLLFDLHAAVAAITAMSNTKSFSVSFIRLYIFSVSTGVIKFVTKIFINQNISHVYPIGILKSSNYLTHRRLTKAAEVFSVL